jgi:hypothetical protein
MRASELIRELQEKVASHGDLPVMIDDDDFGTPIKKVAVLSMTLQSPNGETFQSNQSFHIIKA